MNEIQAQFKEMLLSTNREGMENVIERLEKLGFFKAPASTKFHLNYEGGLLEHSMNVCDLALELRDLMFKKKDGLRDALPKESVIIAALLHDVCKADIYKPAWKNRRTLTLRAVFV
jgi:23S rRNA maturation-related 3'-5' exoribonuclease YhaM